MVVRKDDRGAELFLRVSRGDEEAFRELFEMYAKPMVNYSYRYLGNWHDAEEAAQEIFLRLYRMAPRYERRASFKTFIYRVATNVLLNWLRDHPRDRRDLHPEEIDALPAAERDLEADLDRKALLARVAGELPRLAERERAALVLVALEGHSYEEAAEVLETSFRGVKSLVFRARARLTSLLKEPRK
jgi:RNA polymerase sigma-70 factor (ECF subfamily)